MLEGTLAVGGVWKIMNQVITSVIDEYTFDEVELDGLRSVVRGIDDVRAVVLTSGAESVRELATWVGLTVEDLSDGVSGLFARNIGPDNSGTTMVSAVFVKRVGKSSRTYTLGLLLHSPMRTGPTE
jgi:hypothetical protein